MGIRGPLSFDEALRRGRQRHIDEGERVSGRLLAQAYVG